VGRTRPTGGCDELNAAAIESLLATWPKSEVEALAVQQALHECVLRDDDLTAEPRFVAGVDVAYALDESMVCAGVAVIDTTTLQPVEVRSATRPVEFAYAPGLFAFRELPAVLQALAEVTTPLDLLVCDGHGIAHPRRFGLASHLGVLLDLPCIGAAKSRLIGSHDKPAAARGSSVPLLDGEEVIGAVLRTQRGVRPIYVSIGHRIGLASATAWVLRLCPHYRLPESTRQADQLVKRRLREASTNAGLAPTADA
jgi:deoxyribonuclease V